MLPKIQHYVPQFILRNFCFNENEQIYVFDKKTEKIFSTNIKNIAAESGFNNFKINDATFSIEPNLANLEATGAEIIRKIVEQESLSNITKDERIKLSIFVAAQFFRVKRTRDTMKQVYSIIFDYIRNAGGDPNKILGIDLKDDELKILSVASLINIIVKSAPVFYDKTWMLFKSTESLKYYISDNPIVLQNHNDFSPYSNLGLAFKGIEIYFPISSNLCLGLLDRGIEDTLRWGYKYVNDNKTSDLKNLGIDERTILSINNLMEGLESGNACQYINENVVNLNSLQVIFSTRFLFSSNQGFDLVHEMLKKNPKLKDPPQLKYFPST